MLIEHVLSHFTKFVKARFLAQKFRFSAQMSNNAKNAMKHSENTTYTCLEAFKKCFENTVLGSKIRFSAQMSNNAKKKWNTQKTPTIRVLRLFKNFFKIWFSAQKSGSRLRCRTMLKNTLKHTENTNKTCFEAFLEILENPVFGSKMWFLAQISNYAKIPWNTQKTPTRHVLRLFKKFLKIRFSAQKSGSRPRCRTMLKILWNTQKTPTKHVLTLFEKFLKIWFSAQNPVLCS